MYMYICIYFNIYVLPGGKELNKSINPDEAVAYGAAVQVYVHINIHTYIHTYIHIYICMYVCICIYIYTYICISKHQSLS